MSNGVIAIIVLSDLDLLFEGKQIEPTLVDNIARIVLHDLNVHFDG